MRTKEIDPTYRKSLWMGSTAAWIFLSALALSPDHSSSFSSPQPTRPLTVPTQSRRSSSRHHGRGKPLNLLPFDRNTNGTDWPNTQLPAHTSFVREDATATKASFLGDSDSTVATLLEQELLEGYVAHQANLKSMNDPLDLEESYGLVLLEQELLEGYIAHQDIALQDDLNTKNNLLDLEEKYKLVSKPSETNIEQDTIITQEPISTSTTPSSIIPVLSDVWKARLLLLLSAALYGTNFTMVKSLNDSMSVGMSSTLRFGFAAVAMLPWLFAPIDDELKASASDRNSDVGQKSNILSQLTQLMEEPSRLSVALTGMEIGTYAAIGYIAQAAGLKTTTASNSAFICSMAVVTVPILDYIWGKKILRRQVIGAGLAVAGVWALEMGGQQTTISEGDLLSLVQPLMFGLGFWRMEAAMEKYPTEAGKLAASQLLMVFIISFSYLMYSSSPVGDGSMLPSASDISAWLHDPSILGMLFWTGIVTTAFTIYMETLALKTLSAAETTLIFSTEPIFGAAFAATVAHESLGMDSLIGAAFIICGCIVSGVDVGRFFTKDKVIDI